MSHGTRTPLDRDVAVLLRERGGVPPVTVLTPQEARARVSAADVLCAAGPDLVEVREDVVAGPDGPLRLRQYRAVHSPTGLIVYLHGGGWVTGDLQYSDEICRVLASQSGLAVVSVDYRHAPEHPFPAAVEDAEHAVLWASQRCTAGMSLVVAGDSAGANLAAACVHRARERGSPALALQVLIYPVLDHEPAGVSYRDPANAVVIGAADMAWFWDHYVPDLALRDNPAASPGRVPDLSGLPPAIVVVAGYDPLSDEGTAHARRLQAAGVPVTLLTYPSLPHGFLRFTARVAAAAAARDEIASAVGATLGRASDPQHR